MSEKQNGIPTEFERPCYVEEYYEATETVDDRRFGSVVLMRSRADAGDVLMLKEKRSDNAHDAERDVFQARDRLALRHACLLKMVDFSARPSPEGGFVVRGYYEFAEWDLEREVAARATEARHFSEADLLKLAENVLDCLAFLQEGRMVHGDVRPQYVRWRESEDARPCQLLDRMGDPSPPNQVQLRHLRKQHRLYMSPAQFKSLAAREAKVRHNPYKSDVFSLGVLLLEAGLLRPVQDIYDVPAADINVEALLAHLDDFCALYDHELVKELVCLLLDLDEKSRRDPRAMLQHLQQLLGVDELVEEEVLDEEAPVEHAQHIQAEQEHETENVDESEQHSNFQPDAQKQSDIQQKQIEGKEANDETLRIRQDAPAQHLETVDGHEHSTVRPSNKDALDKQPDVAGHDEEEHFQIVSPKNEHKEGHIVADALPSEEYEDVPLHMVHPDKLASEVHHQQTDRQGQYTNPDIPYTHFTQQDQRLTSNEQHNEQPYHNQQTEIGQNQQPLNQWNDNLTDRQQQHHDHLVNSQRDHSLQPTREGYDAAQHANLKGQQPLHNGSNQQQYSQWTQGQQHLAHDNHQQPTYASQQYQDVPLRYEPVRSQVSHIGHTLPESYSQSSRTVVTYGDPVNQRYSSHHYSQLQAGVTTVIRREGAPTAFTSGQSTVPTSTRTVVRLSNSRIHAPISAQEDERRFVSNQLLSTVPEDRRQSANKQISQQPQQQYHPQQLSNVSEAESHHERSHLSNIAASHLPHSQRLDESRSKRELYVAPITHKLMKSSMRNASPHVSDAQSRLHSDVSTYNYEYTTQPGSNVRQYVLRRHPAKSFLQSTDPHSQSQCHQRQQQSIAQGLNTQSMAPSMDSLVIDDGELTRRYDTLQLREENAGYKVYRVVDPDAERRVTEPQRVAINRTPTTYIRLENRQQTDSHFAPRRHD